MGEAKEIAREWLNACVEGFWDMDLQTGEVYISPRFWEHCGYDPAAKKLHVSEWESIVHPEDKETLNAMFHQRECVESEAPCHIEIRYRHAMGHWVWMICRGQIIERDQDGVPLRMVGTHTDISDLKKTQEELEKISKELERSNEDLQQFAYAASHDLQEPLRTVRSFVQLFNRQYQGKIDERADEYLHFIVDGAERMRNLIEGLLTYSRVQRAAMDGVEADSNLALKIAIKNLKMALDESGADIQSDDLPPVLANQAQLVQLFQNLLANAIRFREESRPLVIRVTAEIQNEEWCKFSIQDNGIGMNPEHADRIFVIFQRLHTRDEYPGTGIGLALCKRIVEHFGGRIGVASSPGEGATFHFVLKLPQKK